MDDINKRIGRYARRLVKKYDDLSYSNEGTERRLGRRAEMNEELDYLYSKFPEIRDVLKKSEWYRQNRDPMESTRRLARVNLICD